MVKYAEYANLVRDQYRRSLMVRMSIINKTDLARRTRQVVDRARRGDTIIVESYGEEQVVVMDAVTIASCAPWRPTKCSRPILPRSMTPP